MFADREAANQHGTLVTIKVDRADGMRPGTPVRFKGLDVGKIESVDLSADMQSVLLSARITQVADRIARAGSQFWVVKPELGLMKTSNLETLVTGQYIEVLPAAKMPAHKEFRRAGSTPEAVHQEAGRPHPQRRTPRFTEGRRTGHLP